MTDSEKIIGKRKLEIIKELKEMHSLIRMHLWGQDYETLTVISEIQEKKKDGFLLIDFPEDFNSLVAADEDWELQFEFTGKDGLLYSFNASGGDILNNRLRLKIPDFIERKQRRKSFRMEAPSGFLLRFTKDDIQFEMRVIDISLGGAAVMPLKQIQHESVFGIGNKVKDVELIFSADTGQKPVPVRMSIIIRREKNPITGKDQYAVHFTHLEPDAEKALTDIIYQFQRQFLRQRLRINE